MADLPRAVVEAIAFDHPPRAHLHFRSPIGTIMWEDRSEIFFPGFAREKLELVWLGRVFNDVSVAVLASAFLLGRIWVGIVFVVPISFYVGLGRDFDLLEARWKDHVERSV